MPSDREASQASTSKVHFALQEGFANEEVHIHCNDVNLYKKENVTTDIRYGLADSFEVTLQDGMNRVKISLPKRSIDQEFQIQSRSPQYVGISLEDGDLKLKFSDEPFGYL